MNQGLVLRFLTISSGDKIFCVNQILKRNLLGTIWLLTMICIWHFIVAIRQQSVLFEIDNDLHLTWIVGMTHSFSEQRSRPSWSIMTWIGAKWLMPIKSPSYHNFLYFRVHVNIYLDHKIYFVECASFGAVLYSKATERLDCYNCPATVSSDKIKRTVKPTWQYNGGKIKAWIFDPVLCLFVVKVRFKCKSGLTELGWYIRSRSDSLCWPHKETARED